MAKCEHIYEYDGGNFFENGVLRGADMAFDDSGKYFAVASKIGACIYHVCNTLPLRLPFLEY